MEVGGQLNDLGRRLGVPRSWSERGGESTYYPYRESNPGRPLNVRRLCTERKYFSTFVSWIGLIDNNHYGCRVRGSRVPPTCVRSVNR